MKYIKGYNESSSDETVVKYIEDIFLQFSDEGMTVDISKNNAKDKLSFGAKALGFIVGAGEFPDIFTKVTNRSQDEPFSHYVDAIYHLLSYMKQEGYRICDFNVWLTIISPVVKSYNISLYKDLKPSNQSIKSDPLAWLEKFLLDTNRSNFNIKEISISFMKSKTNEGWSDDYTTDFTDNGFELSEYPSLIKGSYKGNFVISDVNDWFSEMIGKLTTEYRVLRTKTFFNQITGNANFEVEVTEQESESINVISGNNVIEYLPSTWSSFDGGIYLALYVVGRLKSGQKRELNIFCNKTKDSIEFYLGQKRTGISVDKENLKKLFDLIEGGQIECNNRDRTNETQIINSMKERLL